MKPQNDSSRLLRPDIQLMRGIAVLAVMFAHFGALMPGGFLGVDIFFVISGFVIAVSFLKLWETEDSLSRLIRTFWQRRFWRLFPTLAVVLLVTLIIAFFLVPAPDFRDHLEMTVWSFFFAGNLGVEAVSRQDYFDPAPEFNWLLHLWSLGVEEQFYIVFPFFMLAILSRIRGTYTSKLLIGAITLVSVVSFLAAMVDDLEFAVFGAQQRNDAWSEFVFGYFSPLTRAWQFAVGVFVALISRGSPGGRRSPFLTVSGVVLLALALLFTPESNLHPGPLALVPVAAMALLIRCPPSRRVTDSTATRPIIWLGNRSYSAYLWHYPVWSILTYFFEQQIALVFAAFATTLVLSELTYRFVELPLINRYRTIEVGHKSRAIVVRLRSLVIAATLCSPLWLSGLLLGIESQVRDSYEISQRMGVPRIDPALDCLQTRCEGISTDVLLIGDSHGGALANALSASLAREGLSMRGAIALGCLHIPSERISSVRKECVEASNTIRKLVSDLRPTFVVLYGYTAGRFTTVNSGVEQSIALIDNKTGAMISENNGPSAYQIGLEQTVEIVEQAHGHLFMVSGTPDFRLRPADAGRNDELASFADILFSPYSGPQLVGEITLRDEQAMRHGPFRRIEQELAIRNESVSWIDSWVALCGVEVCRQVDDDGKLIFTDQDHLSEFGAQRLAASVAEQIAEQAQN